MVTGFSSVIYPPKKAKIKARIESKIAINVSLEEILRRRAITKATANTVIREIRPKTPFKKLAKNREPIKARIKTMVIETRIFFTVFLSSEGVGGFVSSLFTRKPYFPNWEEIAKSEESRVDIKAANKLTIKKGKNQPGAVV